MENSRLTPKLKQQDLDILKAIKSFRVRFCIALKF